MGRAGAVRADVDQLRRDLDQLRRDVIADSTETDQQAEVSELRLTALEEILPPLAAVVGVRRRVARELRASVAHVQGEMFAERRIEAIGSGCVRPLWRQR